MKRKRAYTIITLLALTLAWVARGAEPWVSFRHIGIEQGLSHSTVPSIAQDSLGYIWVATQDGLNRYDGHSFKIYRNDRDNDRSLPDNVVKRVICDPAGNLWIVCAGTLVRYDRRLDSFESNPLPEGDHSELNLAVPLDSGAMLLGTSEGLYRFDIAERRYSPLITDITVNALAATGGYYFIGNRNGCYRLKAGSRKPERLPGVSTPVNALYNDGREIWIATEGEGVWRHNLSTGKTSKLDIPLRSAFVRALCKDYDGRLWIGTINGLIVYDPAEGSTRTFTTEHYTTGATPLSHSSIRSIFADRHGGIWIGTWFGGLNYCHPLQNRFRHIGTPPLNDKVVSCIIPDGDIIYIGTNGGGLNIYDRLTDRVRFITLDDGLASTDVKAVYADKAKGLLYVGTHLGGLSVFDLRSHRLIRRLPQPQRVYSLLPARDGRLWVGTLAGLYRYDPATVTIENINSPFSNVTDIYRDSRGRLWLSGEHGVALFNEGPGAELSRIPLPENLAELTASYIYNVYESPADGNLYLSSRRGLWALSPDLKLLGHYTTADGLPNDIVLGAVADNNGDLWLSTNGGLSEFDPENKAFRNYGLTDYQGVRQFNAKAIARLDNSRMWFGGVGGIITFAPDRINADTISARPLVNGIRVFGSPVTPGDGSGVLASTVETGKKVLLHPGQSMVTFDFTSLNFHNNGHNSFRYRMDGLDKGWIDAGSERSATYRNIPPGVYRFEVQSSNSDNLWSDAQSVEVRVLPYWYQRWWVQLIGLIIIGVVIWSFVRRFTLRRLDEQHREYEKRDYERRQELNDMKVNFFVNMSHELRTPLTLILLPATELIEQKRSEPKVLDKLRTIHSNTLRILNIINQILDYQRAENGMFPLRVRPVDVNGFLAGELRNYNARATHDNIDCRLDSTVGDERLPLDPTYLSIIIGNLLSNAFKHTPAGKSVKLSARLTDDGKSLEIKVSDTGYGINPAKLPHIFDRFYKVEENSYGSGIGLSLVKRLVTLHHGSISVESVPDQGTSFTITLPAEEGAYAPDERAAADEAETKPLQLHYLPGDGEEAAPDTADTEAAPAPDGEEGAERPSVMLVDDNETILKYMSEALAPLYRVILARDGAEALQLLEEQLPDMVITDVMMPRTDGIQLCRAIKRNIRTSHIPVMMLSAKSDVRDQLDAMKVGADDYLPKPFSMPLLLAKIANRFRTRASAIKFYADTPGLEPVTMAMNPLDEEFLTNAIKMVEQHMDDSEFTTDGFARAMLMSRSNLHVKLKALTGESANEFIRRIRMNRALELLKSGRYTVSEVSAMVGYSTPSYFSTSFKKFFGSQPSDHIKS